MNKTEIRVPYIHSKTAREKIMIENLREVYSIYERYYSNIAYDKLRNKHRKQRWYSAIAIMKHFTGWKKALVAAGLPTRPLPKFKGFRRERISNTRQILSSQELPCIEGMERSISYARRYLEGESMREIGEAEGVSRQFVHILIKRLANRLEVKG